MTTSAAGLPGDPGRMFRAVGLSWLLLMMALIGLRLIGLTPNLDVDDMLKMHEIRHVLMGSSIFDRTIPGIAQPEPMISHWPWIVDAPYALFAWLLAPFTGLEIALQTAAFVIPLVMLAFVLVILYRIYELLGFAWPGSVLLVSTLLSVTAFVEFQPGRIDYHNLQMVLICVALLFTMRGGTASASGAGAVTALSFAIGGEMTPLLAVLMGYLALRFIGNRNGASRELLAFGSTLALSAFAAFVVVTLPQGSDLAACDRFAVPYLLALAGAGLTFALTSFFMPQSSGLLVRSMALGAGAAVTVAPLVVLYPSCLGGPYGDLNVYVRDHWLKFIDQEMSMLAGPWVFAPNGLGKLVLAFLGAGAAIIAGWNARHKSRAWAVYGLFCTAALIMTVVLARYLRFLPLFATPGLVLILARSLPGESAFREWLSQRESYEATPAVALMAPSLILIAALMGWRSIFPPAKPELQAAAILGRCESAYLPSAHWPEGSRLLAPPGIGIRMMEKLNAPEVVAVPFHTAAAGIERVYRFFDPATLHPREWLAKTGATHVAVCRADLPADMVAAFPLAAGLAAGRAPDWLIACPHDKGAIRVYRAGDAACP